jgi:predicted Fe-Mo cluster-binding NifX family protein
MKIVVSAQGENLNAPASPVFGRCPVYLFVDTETMEFEAVPNPAMNQGGGAGIQAAQFVVERGAQAVLSGNLGPNAFNVLQAAGVASYLVPEGTVRQAVEAFKGGRIQSMGGANVAAHAGMGTGAGSSAGDQVGPSMRMGRGMGRGMGGGMGGGMGRGMGRGMGGGMGRGMGGGMGRGMGGGMGSGMGQRGEFQEAMPAQPATEVPPDLELEQLHATLRNLRQQLAETMDRIDQLEKQK